MKKLSDFEDDKGIEIAAKILEIIMVILQDDRNEEMKGEENIIKMVSTFMKNSPAEMRQIFAILSEQDPETYHCNGAEAMTNMLILINDPVVVSLFISPSQMGDATSSGSPTENTEEN